MPKASGSDRAESKDFKDRISPEAVATLASDLKQAWPGFPDSEFQALATSSLAGLELKARVNHVSQALAATMPEDFDDAAEVVRRATGSADFDGWIVFCVNDWVARSGLDNPDVALPLLGELTSRWSAEFAIRPFIEAHQQRTFGEFDLWIESSDEHRRRLVSEGSRPRLPWGRQLRAFIADPTPTIALLDRLVDDPSPYVRKSVANHLNDISKDHPALAVETAAGWVAEQPESDRRRRIASQGLRSLVKAGDPDALLLLGYDPEAPVVLTSFGATPAEVAIGDAIEIEFSLTAPVPTPAMVDFRIHHAGAAATRKPKVFKLKKTTLEPGVETAFRREHRIRQVSVRKIHPGPHLIEIQVNGRVLAAATIQVKSD